MRSKKKSSINFHDNTMINVLRQKLFQWTCERHATNQPLNREILGDKVIDLSTELGLKDFKFSRSWLTTFLKKHGFSPSLASSYGPIFNDYREWIEMMRSYMMQYRYKNVFQVDEMGMYHDISPDDIPQFVNYVTCKNGENRKNRVTVLLCCNASGDDRLPPVICGKFENQVDVVNRSCQYYANQNAWLTPDIFKLWLSQLNTKMSKLNRKILLLLNRTHVHTLKNAVLSNISLMFFPNDFPTSLQPLRSSIFHYVKMIYRRNYTRKMLQPNFNWNVTDTVTNIVDAWQSIPKELILTSFRKTNFRTDNDQQIQISCPEWESLNPCISFHNYVTFDDNLCVSSSSSVRRSKRLAKIRKMENNQEIYTLRGAGSHQGRNYEIVELGDSELDEDVIEEVSRCSEMSKFTCNLPLVNLYDRTADGLTRRENRDVRNSRNSEPKAESDLRLPQCSRRHRRTYFTGAQRYSSPLTDTVILYISDIVKNAIRRAVDNVPDLMGLTDGSKSQASMGDITNHPLVREDDEPAPIGIKRKLEKTDEGDVPNDDSREPRKKNMRKEQWSDVYEHCFVFGTPESPLGIHSTRADVQTGSLLRTVINSSEKNDDLEKKSIFTNSFISSTGTQNE